jgi:hypothetical protein
MRTKDDRAPAQRVFGLGGVPKGMGVSTELAEIPLFFVAEAFQLKADSPKCGMACGENLCCTEAMWLMRMTTLAAAGPSAGGGSLMARSHGDTRKEATPERICEG